MAFVVFHKLLFRNEYWLFDYRTDPVIMVLPDQFFMHVALAMIAVALLCSGICFAIYAMLRKRATKA
jgi:integral membrane protein (TIGR01906 family)